MRLKGIALLVVAMLLVVGSVAAIAAAGAEDRSSDEEWRTDARYWWEVWWEGAPLTPYQREQIGEITALILDRYFGIEDSLVMSPDEFERVIRPFVGHEKEWEALHLFGYYAQKRGFEVPAGVFVVPSGFETPPGIPALIEKLPAQEYVPEPYWWEIVGYPRNPEKRVAATIAWIAEVKGIPPDEVERRFGELFPGVDLWRMTLYEYDRFIDSLPRPPLRPVCFEELKGNPYIIALFGRVPPLSTEEELEKFNEKLRKVLRAACPLLCKLPRCEFPFALMGVHRGAISIGVSSEQLPQAEVVYRILAEKAESLFGIKDVPVIFSKATGVRFLPEPRLASSGWRPPWNEPFPRILGGAQRMIDLDLATMGFR